MRWVRSSWLFLPALLILACPTLIAQQRDWKDITPEAKDKIAGWVKHADNHTILIFDRHSGDFLEDKKIPEHAAKESDSLQDFIRLQGTMYQGSAGKVAGKHNDPVADCEEPKPLPPPPTCVLCKTGHVLCSNAAFGKAFDPMGAIN